jgi:membrane-bound lytic murein transglycosylase D
MTRLFFIFALLPLTLLQGCAHFDQHVTASPNAQTEHNEQPTQVRDDVPPLDAIHIATFDQFLSENTVQPLVLPHAPAGWLVEYDHQPLPLEVVEQIDRPSDLMQRIREGFALDLESDNKRIQAQLNWYLRHPEYLDRVFTRASRYMYHIVDRLEEENIPLEIALLPVVESAFNAFAYSHGRASGLWQFIPGTGKMYDMHQDWWFDGRRDVLLSTEGAIRYLSWLNKKFDGDWLHALASYNTGSGRVARSIRRNLKAGKPTDFWSLKLPRETRAYVPKLLAISKIVADPAKYNITLKSIPNQPYFDVVKLDSQIDLAQAANIAELDIEEIYQLNPGLNQWATPPSGPFRLLMPVTKSEQFEQRLASIPKSERLTWDSYKVKKGDALARIARKFHTTPSLIAQVNKLRGNRIYEGQELLIPVASQNKRFYNLSEQNRIASVQTKVQGKNGASKVFYTVKAGDTFWDISRAHKVGIRQLAKWNSMAPGDVLRPGKQLLIWSNTAGKTQVAQKQPTVNYVPSLNSSYAPRDKLKRLSYRVRNGDSLWRIANRFNVSVNELKQWNNLGKKKYLQPGQRLTVFVDITKG